MSRPLNRIKKTEVLTKKRISSPIKKDKAISLSTQLSLLTRSVVEQFPNDPTFPKVGISYLPHCAQFYGSIIRYKETWGRGGFVVVKAQFDTLEEVFKELFKLWRAKIQPTQSASEALLRSKTGV